MKNKIFHEVKLPDDARLEVPTRIYSGVRIKKNVNIGRFTFVSINTVIENNSKIGRFCSIAADVKIGVHPHPIDYLSTHSFQYNKAHFDFVDGYTDGARVTFKKPGKTIIGNDVWVGTNVTISKGVKIGDGAVIAAHAFVKSDVPAYGIVGGVPAKIIRFRFPDKTINELLDLQWWNLMPWDMEGVDFTDINSAIKEIRLLSSDV